MNNTVFYDTTVSDNVRRQMLFDGQLFAYSPRPSSLAFITHARQMIEEAFAPLNPELAQRRRHDHTAAVRRSTREHYA